MNSGRFYRLTNYCMVEYIPYSENPQQTVINPKFKVLHNKYDGNVQSFNLNQYNNITYNIQDYTVVHTEGNRYVNIDQDRVPDYLDVDNNLIHYEPSQIHYNYDIIRVHFLSGFKFTEFAAIILNVSYPLNDGHYGILSNFMINQSNYVDVIELNTHPIYMTDGYFDRYVDIIIPSIHKMNIEYYTSVNPEQTLAAKLTPRLNAVGNGFDGHIGFVQNQPISVNLYQSDSYYGMVIDDTKYDTFDVNNLFMLSITDSNKFDGLSAYINESDKGNFIEYGMLHFGNYPEGFISDLNKLDPNSNWVIIHELTVYEHIGAIEKKSSEYVYVQRDNFDEFMSFRPVLKYASDDLAFTIDYILRLVDQNSGEQIIRHGSLTLTNPKSYGYDTRSIRSDFSLNPYKIYNKNIIKSGIDKSESYDGNKKNQEPRVIYVNKVKEIKTTIKIPYIVNILNIGLSDKSVYNKVQNYDNLIQGQGKMVLKITPFDNYYKFVVYDKTIDNKFVPMDLNIVDELKVVFKVGNKEYHIKSENKPTNSEKILSSSGLDTKEVSHSKTESTKSKNVFSSRPIKKDDERVMKPITPKFDSVKLSENIEVVNAGNGEILFKLAKETASILYQYGSGEFFINTVREDGSEMTLYYGLWQGINKPELKSTEKIKKVDIKNTETNDKKIYGDTNINVSKKIEIPNYKGLVDPNGNVSVVNKIKPISDI